MQIIVGEHMFYPLIKKVLFQIDPEQVHEFTFRQLKHISETPFNFLIRQALPTKSVDCMGLSFKNPVGLAAGFDKDGDCIDALGMMGFGFIEVGTVTPKAQEGNEKPRLFRLVEAQGLINRMGFNNKGVDNLVNNIKKSRYGGIIGINIGKNKVTPIEKGKEDYLTCMDKVYTHAGYIAINISSPNTPGLRTLQYGEALDDLLSAIKQRQNELKVKYKKYVPITLKIAPDLTEAELVQIADSVIRHNIDGIIATNTTLQRDLVKGLNHCEQLGGLSGRPIQLISTDVIKRLSNELNNRIPIIGVGGIDSVIAAKEKFAAGASLIQLYTGFIYHGPRLLKDIVNYI